MAKLAEEAQNIVLNRVEQNWNIFNYFSVIRRSDSRAFPPIHRWRPEGLQNGKVWWKISPDPDTEVAWLQAEVYGQNSKVPVIEITALNRFSERVWDFG
jgi:hypothetical protein